MYYNFFKKRNAEETDTVLATHEIIDLIKLIDEQQTENNSSIIIEEIKKGELDFSKIFQENNFENFICNFLEADEERKKILQESREKNKLKINSFGEGTSNSYLHYVLKYCKENLFSTKKIKIETKLGKNSDFTVILKVFLI